MSCTHEIWHRIDDGSSATQQWQCENCKMLSDEPWYIMLGCDAPRYNLVGYWGDCACGIPRVECKYHGGGMR